MLNLIPRAAPRLTRLMAGSVITPNPLPSAAPSRIMVRSLSRSPSEMTPIRLPISGPPGYETLSKRLEYSREVQSYYFHKTAIQNEANGHLVDIHDGINTEDYDVLITDIGLKELSNEISNIFGVQYLSDVGDHDSTYSVQRAKGIIWGRNRRCLLTLAVKADERAKWVHFLWDNGSPKTYLAQEAADALGVDATDMETPVQIGGHIAPVTVVPGNSHFKGVNILGMDYIALHNISAFLDPKKRIFTFYYGMGGKMPFPEA